MSRSVNVYNDVRRWCPRWRVYRWHRIAALGGFASSLTLPPFSPFTSASSHSLLLSFALVSSPSPSTGLIRSFPVVARVHAALSPSLPLYLSLSADPFPLLSLFLGGGTHSGGSRNNGSSSSSSSSGGGSSSSKRRRRWRRQRQRAEAEATAGQELT